ncbi:PREDICTED: indole glucosinolate O-methyltransferase 4-like [Tarenaya hassleriana]|uniref:indole glucosinolate O-methyltransferase 4-like n=1 Tax=Tarenaya hassleriana TaxID=28532 RepID=UPI00053C87B3|nr:PREDICTED: indole glucosinolate O-methyltransferase 4-like [Tarenaya hassleriana]
MAPVPESVNPNPKTRDHDDELGLRAVRLANAAAFPMVFKAAIELGVLDTLCNAAVSAVGDGAWLSPSQIASGLPTEPRNPQAPILLDRMLRLLASYSVVKCRARNHGVGKEVERVYAAEPICRFFLMKADEDLGSLASQVIVNLDSVFLNTWVQLKDVVLEGGDAFGRAHGNGVKLFDYMDKDKRFSSLFNRVGFTTAVMKKVLEVYKGFEAANVVVDVGGGVGITLGAITAKYPNIRGINFDLKCALAHASSYPGVEHVAGDMFVDVPKGDIIVMKRILHDWTDEDSVKILKNCWKALPENGKVMVIEIVVPDSGGEDHGAYSNIAFDMDMLMFTQCSGGKERTKAEFEALAMESGFACCRFICRAYHCWVIEFCKEA